MNVLKRQGGFTIIELLYGIVIFTVITGSIIPLFTKAIASNNTSRKRLYACEAAHAEIEKMRNDLFENLSDHTFSLLEIPGATGNIDVDDNIEGNQETDIVKVTATVSWTAGSKNENVEIVSYIAKKGIY